MSQCVVGLAKDCEVPKALIFIYIPNIVVIFYMFYDFFKKAYNKKQMKKAGAKAH